jgi:hypothetical protein
MSVGSHDAAIFGAMHLKGFVGHIRLSVVISYMALVL